MKLLPCSLLIISTIMTAILGSITKAKAAERQPLSIESKARKWKLAIHSKHYDQARTLCESWLGPKNSARVKAEAHKCLANVELASSTGTAPLGTSDIIVGPRPPWYLDPGAGRAIKHLTDGIELSPDDITIHQGRLHIVSYSRYRNELPQYLKLTLNAYPRREGLHHWLAYCEELETYKDFGLMMEFLRVLEERFPHEAGVHARLRDLFSETEKDDEALSHAKRAIELDPKDAENVWQLGMIQRRLDDLAAADSNFGRAIQLQKDPERQEYYACNHALFIREKLKNYARACDLERRACPLGIDKSCGNP